MGAGSKKQDAGAPRADEPRALEQGTGEGRADAAPQFGLIGLGVMGTNLALNIEEHGFPVAVWNVTTDAIDRFMGKYGEKRFTPKRTLPELIAALPRPRKILMMILAGDPVDQVIAQLRPLLESGDILIDGGNSWYRDTHRRQQELQPLGIRLIGCGVSGGADGARNGPSLMPGGDQDAYEQIRPVLEAIAAKTESGPCVTYIGSGASGHFVKMIHNGIEYADMQLIAEVYDLLRRGLGMDLPEMARLFSRWNEGPLESFLIHVTAKILTVTDPETGLPLLDLVDDRAGQKGTGRWAVQEALKLGVVVPTIAAAVDARVQSSMKEQRQEAARLYPLPAFRADAPDRQAILGRIEEALHAGKICAYSQGMNTIRAAAESYGWKIHMREIARIWKGGCIIRARFLDVIMRAYAQDPDLQNLLLDPELVERMSSGRQGLGETVEFAQGLGIPVPALASSLAYFDSYRSPRLPQNLTQAQRDAFGAHTYERVDQPERGPIHTDWLGIEEG